MFSNNISMFSSNPGGKSLFHQSVYNNNNSSVNNSTVDANKIYNLLYGLESRVTDSVSVKVLESENRTFGLLNSLFSNPALNNTNVSRNLYAAIQQRNVQLEEPYLTVVDIIVNNIQSSNDAMRSTILNKIEDQTFDFESHIYNVNKSVKLNTSLIRRLDSKLNVIDNHISGIANSISVLLSTTVSQIQSAINTAISKTESKILNSQSALSDAISGAESKILSGQSTLSGAISSAESKILSGQSALSGAISSVESKILSGQSTLCDAISSAESKILSGQSTLSDAISGAESKILSGQSALSGAISSAESKILSGQSALNGAISSAESKILSGHTDIENLIKAIPTCCCENGGGDISGGDIIGSDISGDHIIYSDISGSDISGSTITNSTIINSTLINCDISGGTGTNTVESKLIHELVISDCVTTIIGYYSNFALGNFEEVRENLTIETFEALSKQLFLFKSSLADTSDYEIVRNIIVKSFEALMQMINQFISCEELEVRLEAVSKKAAILDDVQALEDYIKKLVESANVKVLPEVTFTAPLFSIKPEIQMYIDLYGFPEGGVFDVDKLGALIPK